MQKLFEPSFIFTETTGDENIELELEEASVTSKSNIVSNKRNDQAGAYVAHLTPIVCQAWAQYISHCHGPSKLRLC